MVQTRGSATDRQTPKIPKGCSAVLGGEHSDGRHTCPTGRTVRCSGTSTANDNDTDVQSPWRRAQVQKGGARRNHRWPQRLQLRTTATQIRKCNYLNTGWRASPTSRLGTAQPTLDRSMRLVWNPWTQTQEPSTHHPGLHTQGGTKDARLEMAAYMPRYRTGTAQALHTQVRERLTHLGSRRRRPNQQWRTPHEWQSGLTIECNSPRRHHLHLHTGQQAGI